MASTIVITVSSDLSQAHAQQKTQLSGKRKEGAQALAQLFKDLASGQQSGTVSVQTADAAPVAASGTFTLTSVAEDDSAFIGLVEFVAKASPSSETEFSQAGNDAADAAALAAKINAHSTVSKVVVASAANNVVTITALQKGVVGNQIFIDRSGGVARSGATLTGGTGGAAESATTYVLGQ